MMRLVRACLWALGAIALPALGQGPPPFTIIVTNEVAFSPVDRAHTLVGVSMTTPGAGFNFRCDGNGFQRVGFDITVTVNVDAGPQDAELCHRFAQVDVGRLDAGHYSIHANLLFAGSTLATPSTTVDVEPRANQCNAYPLFDEATATPVTKTPDAFVAAFNDDPAYRARFGDIGHARVLTTVPGRVALRFPPLSDPVVEADVAEGTGEVNDPSIPQFMCVYFPSYSPVVAVVEFRDTLHDRYFITADAAEQAAIDAGSSGPGWVRTGRTFHAWANADPCGPLATVFRFTASPLRHADIHFFTADVRECAIVRDTDWVWMFEGIAFAALNVPPGGCPSIAPAPPLSLQPVQTQPLYRAYNAGAGGVPNHRFATDHAIIDTMVAQGWLDEGPVMCVLP